MHERIIKFSDAPNKYFPYVFRLRHISPIQSGMVFGIITANIMANISYKKPYLSCIAGKKSTQVYISKNAIMYKLLPSTLYFFFKNHNISATNTVIVTITAGSFIYIY